MARQSAGRPVDRDISVATGGIAPPVPNYHLHRVPKYGTVSFMLINTHGEAVFRDGEERETSPGCCPQCNTDRKVCGDCGYWLECGECSDGADCICDDEPTVEVSLETSPGRVSLARHVELMTGGRK